MTLIVTSGEVSSIRATGAALRRMGDTLDAARVRAVLNRSAGAKGVHAAEVAQAIGHEIFWEIPYDRGLLAAGQEGEPIVFGDNRSIARNSISALARAIAGTTKTLTTDELSTTPLWKRLINRKGLDDDSADNAVRQPARETQPRSS